MSSRKGSYALQAWSLTKIDEWTTWVLLGLLVIWGTSLQPRSGGSLKTLKKNCVQSKGNQDADLIAVLTPCGPLKLLIESSRRQNVEIPALLYSGMRAQRCASVGIRRDADVRLHEPPTYFACGRPVSMIYFMADMDPPPGRASLDEAERESVTSEFGGGSKAHLLGPAPSSTPTQRPARSTSPAAATDISAAPVATGTWYQTSLVAPGISIAHALWSHTSCTHGCSRPGSGARTECSGGERGRGRRGGTLGPQAGPRRLCILQRAGRASLCVRGNGLVTLFCGRLF